MKRLDFDVAVIGGGSGGYAAARKAAEAGLSVVVIEGGREVGGLCILRGCMPTKALLYAAEVSQLARHAPVWGIEAGPVRLDWTKVMARKDALIGEFADYRRQQLESGTFDFVRQTARFEDAHTLQLADGRRVSASHMVVATGSVVQDPPWPGLKEAGYLDSDGALKMDRLPESIVVLGGGAVAVEFAQMFLRFGVKTTMVQRSDQVLRDFDPDAAEALVQAFRREGMQVYTGTRWIEARRLDRGKIVAFEHGGQRVEVVAEEIFFGLGRMPNTHGLGLAAAGVTAEGPRILTDPWMRTNVPHIYAAGDCTGPHEIVHLAIQQGEIAAHNIARPDQPRTMDYRLLMTVVFTDPQVAVVGLTEKSARAAGRPYVAASYPFSDHGKSMIMDVREGFVKLLADPGTGEILGGCCVGPVGGELIHEVCVAMRHRMTVTDFAMTPHYHPTLAEIWTYPAEALAGRMG